MAGVKGRSGGARPNSGPKRKKPDEGQKSPILQGDKDMLQLLQDVALGRTEATALQVRAAIAAVQYTHAKKGEGGKKDEQADKAKKAASKFAAAPPPRLIVSNK